MTKKTMLKIPTQRTNPDFASFLLVDHDRKKPNEIFISAPRYFRLTQQQAIELANALADLIEEIDR